MAVDLTERVTRMEERVDAELRHMAMREDLMAMETRLMRWMVMIVAAGVGVLVLVDRI